MNCWLDFDYWLILMGFRYLAFSLPILSLIGVSIGVGIVSGNLLSSVSRNPSCIDTLIRWAFIGFSLVETSGFIGIMLSFLLIYALCNNKKDTDNMLSTKL